MDDRQVKLPQLPPATWAMPESMAGKWKVPGAWSADQMREYATAAVLADRQEIADALEEFDNQLSNWARAYPESVFPEPDMTLVRTALEARGITIDCVSASNMRHVATTLDKLFEPVRAALSSTSSGKEGGE